MPIPIPPGEDPETPFGNFAFHVHFAPRADAQSSGSSGFAPFAGVKPEISGGFSEITGLEATMEPKLIKVGGMNYGAIQRAGPVSFSTVVLKRGIIASRHLWDWWSFFAGADGASNGGWGAGSRCDVLIGLTESIEHKVMVGWKLSNAMPVKFKSADLNAKGTEVAVEEIHLVHEGLHMRGVA
jgi:phage tail-like protein